MGRRGNMRGRPGLLFITIFTVCLIVFYFSWRLLVPPDIKPRDDEIYSEQRQSKQSDRDGWRNYDANPVSVDGDNHARDPDYVLADALNKNEFSRQHDNAPLLRHFEKPEDKESIKQDLNKPQPSDVKPEKESISSKKYYREPNKRIIQTLKTMERLVHLDLKGAAPKMSYLKEFIPFVATLGATGLLIEYEDMFPYNGKLESIRSMNSYSQEDIANILQMAKNSNLHVIPLIQTFGHMEFVLKSNFSHLRESEYTPQVIDISSNTSYKLIFEMVKQVLDAHPDSLHIHIGCDEVYELGKGASEKTGLSKPQLFLGHVRRVAKIVKNYQNRGVVPIIWDDELRHLSPMEIESSELPSLIEIMVWRYTDNVLESINGSVWDKYQKNFKSVWIASAFKGATGARQFFTNAEYHIQNHFSWLDIIDQNNNQLEFKGVALTGWQRYDHFAALSDLLPVAVPSLAVCLATMQNGGFTQSIHWSTSVLLRCNRNVEVSFPSIDKKTRKAIVTQDCRFPGSGVYHAMQEFYGYVQINVQIQDRLDGWLSDYHVAHGFSSPGQLKILYKLLQKQNEGYSNIISVFRNKLSEIYFNDTVVEWIDENIKERQTRNKELLVKVHELQQSKTWPRRPLPEGKSSYELIQSDQINEPQRMLNLNARYQNSLESNQRYGNEAKLTLKPMHNEIPSVKESASQKQIDTQAAKLSLPNEKGLNQQSQKLNTAEIIHARTNADDTNKSYKSLQEQQKDIVSQTDHSNQNSFGSADSNAFIPRNFKTGDENSLEHRQESVVLRNEKSVVPDFNLLKPDTIRDNKLTNVDKTYRMIPPVHSISDNKDNMPLPSAGQGGSPVETKMMEIEYNKEGNIKKYAFQNAQEERQRPDIHAKETQDVHHLKGSTLTKNNYGGFKDNGRDELDDKKMDDYEKRLLSNI